MEEVHYCREPSKVKLLGGVREALGALRDAGFRRILVTNQSGIGRGLITLEEYAHVHARLLELLGPDALDATYMCADAPDAPSSDRKPAPGMLLRAVQEWELDLSASWMVGDKDIDIECGVHAGVPSILVRTGHGRAASGRDAARVVEDFGEAVEWILANLPKTG